MHSCEICGKEYKTKVGLNKHSKTHENVTDEIVEANEEVIEQVVTEASESTQKKIKKLLDARKSTWDAEARHSIDLEIKRLKEG